MANISVYKLVPAEHPSITLHSNYSEEKKSLIDDIIKKFHKHSIYICGNNIILPNGKELTNRAEIIDYYINPDKKKKPKNINEIDNIIDSSSILSKSKTDTIQIKTKSFRKFDWINI